VRIFDLSYAMLCLASVACGAGSCAVACRDPTSPRPRGRRVIGRTLLHYEITGELGAGAMGHVYLARDTRTDRRVALKFVSAETASPMIVNSRSTAERIGRLVR